MQVNNSIKFSLATEMMIGAAREAFPEMLDMILNRSNQDVPRDSDRLVDSGATRAEDLQGVVYYGENYDAMPYAVYQHEGARNDGTHVIVNRPAGGKSKFLEDVVNDGAFRAECWDFVASKIKARMG
jgi:hypothetical protein